MSDSQISVRYAKALFKIAQEQNLSDEVYKDMEVLQEICRAKEFMYMLEFPVISSTQKTNITIEILKNRISAPTESLIKLVMKNRREVYLPGIARNFIALYKKDKGIKTASLVTASLLDEATIGKLQNMVEKALKADVDLSAKVDETIIGGFVLTLEDQQYDASVANSLKKIKKQLLETPVIKK